VLALALGTLGLFSGLCLFVRGLIWLTSWLLLAVSRNKYNRRFVNKVEGFGKKGPNSNAGQAN